MTVVTVQEAQNQLPQLIARAEAGEEIVIARDDRPAVRLMLVAAAPDESSTKKHPLRKPGSLAHLRGKIPDSFFFDPLPEEELRLWEDGPVIPPERSD